MSQNDKAIMFCQKHIWAQNAEVDTTLAKPPRRIFRTNELKRGNVKTVRSSLFKNRLGHSITSPMLFCCFTSLFFSLVIFWIFVNYNLLILLFFSDKFCRPYPQGSLQGGSLRFWWVARINGPPPAAQALSAGGSPVQSCPKLYDICFRPNVPRGGRTN